MLLEGFFLLQRVCIEWSLGGVRAKNAFHRTSTCAVGSLACDKMPVQNEHLQVERNTLYHGPYYSQGCDLSVKDGLSVTRLKKNCCWLW